MHGGRQVTVEAQPLDERGLETAGKARIVTGVWNGDDPLGTAPDVGTPQPFNAVPTGLTTLSFESGNDGDVRIALADQRGDGRPDYLYRGRVLYADTVTPLRIALSGGPIVIDGMGFRPGNSVTVGGLAAADHQHHADRNHSHCASLGRRRNRKCRRHGDGFGDSGLDNHRGQHPVPA